MNNNKKSAAMRRVRYALKNAGVIIGDNKQDHLITAFAKLVFNEIVVGKKNCKQWLLQKYDSGIIKNMPFTPKKKKSTTWDKLLWRAKKDCYVAFLDTDYWRAVIIMVKKRDENKCTVCGNTERLQVHHKTYENHFNEHEHLDDLITLCRFCHAKIHNKKPN